MQFNLIYKSSVSACFELNNDTIYYAEHPFKVILNGKEIKEENKNVFSIYNLSPNTEYEIKTSISNFVLKFTTESESYAYSVKSFGATGDGVTDDTVAVQSAINCCPKNGRVVFEEGEYFLRPITIKSDMTVELKKGAVLKATSNEADYPKIPGEFDDLNGKSVHFASWEGTPMECCQPFITLYSANNVHIVGEGVIDGQGNLGDWWVNPKNRRYGRPRLFFTHFSENVYLHGITGRNGASWNFHPYFSKNVNFFNTKVEAPADSPNTDGLDPESCDYVNIIGMEFSVGDDAIAIKAGKSYMGMKYAIPANHHTIRNCKMQFAHGGIVLGSEMSGGVQNLKVERCLFVGTDRGLRIKTRRGRGKNAVIDGVVFDKIKMEGVKAPFVMNMFYFCDPDGKTEYVWSKEKLPVDDRTPRLGEFTFKNIECNNSGWCAGYFYGLPEQPISSVTLENVTVTYDKNSEEGRPAMMTNAEVLKNGGFVFRNVDSVSMVNVAIEGYEGEKIILESVKNTKGI